VKSQTGLSVSVGVTPRKFLSKIASQVAKPDGMIVVQPGEEMVFLHPLSVSYLWGVGPVTERKLHELGLETIGDIADTPVESLTAMLGVGAARHLHALSSNQDPRPVQRTRKAKSLSAQSAMSARVRQMEDLLPVLARLTDRVASRLRKKERSARTVTVKVRFGDLTSVTRSATVAAPTASTGAIVQIAKPLLQKVLDEYPKHETTLLSVAATGLGVNEPIQLALGVDDTARGGGTPDEIESDALDRSVDELRRRFGREILLHGSDLLSGRSDFTDGLSDIMTRDDRHPSDD
jgi:DNA polymerase-4